MVFYRKYRPQKIADLDSVAAREMLKAVLSKDVPHAFLFTGPKGLGKTSTARIVAKVVNCEARGVSRKESGSDKSSMNMIEPCNECEQCLSIINGRNMDVMEIDAASNRGIDEIRDLREKIMLSPLSAKRKVYIIDEVHMLTTEAFNALLKTLEEPPEHAMFVLCTTELQKVPETIISRCFQLQFRIASGEEIANSLKRIIRGESLEVEEEVLGMIAERADGGFRDAAKILEELVLLSGGKKIGRELFDSRFKFSVMKNEAETFVKFLAAKDAKSALQLIGEVERSGGEIKFFLQQVLEVLHVIFLRKAGVADQSNKLLVDFELGIEEINMLYRILAGAYQDMRFAVLQQMPLELAVVEFCARSGRGDVSEKEDGGGEEIVSSKGSLDDGLTVDKLRRELSTKMKKKALYGEEKSEGVLKRKKTKEPEVELMKINGSGEITDEWRDFFWKSMIEEMKGYNHTVAGVLRSCKLKSYDKKRLVVGTNFKFHKERLDDPRAREALLKVCKSLTGNEVEIEIELKKV